MELIPEEMKSKLLENGKPENRDADHSPVIKLFIPMTACTWLLSELNPDNQDIAFGLCDLGMGFPELGSVSLNELESVSLPHGIKVERDEGFKGEFPMSVYAFAAHANQMITDDRSILEKYDLVARKRGGYSDNLKL